MRNDAQMMRSCGFMCNYAQIIRDYAQFMCNYAQ